MNTRRDLVIPLTLLLSSLFWCAALVMLFRSGQEELAIIIGLGIGFLVYLSQSRNRRT